VPSACQRASACFSSLPARPRAPFAAARAFAPSFGFLRGAAVQGGRGSGRPLDRACHAENVPEDALRPQKVWSAMCLNWSIVTRARAPRHALGLRPAAQ
jgi:hypothetical protein